MAKRDTGISEKLRGHVGMAALCDAAAELMTGVPDMEQKLFMLEMLSEKDWPTAEEMYGAMLRFCQSRPKQTVSLFLRMTAANTSFAGGSPEDRLGQLDRLDQLVDLAKRRGLVSRKAGREVDQLAERVYLDILTEGDWLH